MSQYSADGAQPVDDAAVDDPPTVDEVLERQAERDDVPDPDADPDHQQVVDEPAVNEDEEDAAGSDGLEVHDSHARRVADPDDGPG